MVFFFWNLFLILYIHCHFFFLQINFHGILKINFAKIIILNESHINNVIKYIWEVKLHLFSLVVHSRMKGRACFSATSDLHTLCLQWAVLTFSIFIFPVSHIIIIIIIIANYFLSLIFTPFHWCSWSSVIVCPSSLLFYQHVAKKQCPELSTCNLWMTELWQPTTYLFNWECHELSLGNGMTLWKLPQDLSIVMFICVGVLFVDLSADFPEN